jgi:hypothetical protein
MHTPVHVARASLGLDCQSHVVGFARSLRIHTHRRWPTRAGVLPLTVGDPLWSLLPQPDVGPTFRSLGHC